MARSWSLAVILCVFALRMRTTSQQICSPMNSVPMVETNPPSTANVIIVRCTSVGPSNPISNPVWYLNGENMNESRCFQGSSPDNNQLTFTITPDCEGYLQCGIPPMQATCAVSRPKPVYGEVCAHQECFGFFQNFSVHFSKVLCCSDIHKPDHIMLLFLCLSQPIPNALLETPEQWELFLGQMW